MKKLKEKVKEWLVYALPLLICIGMFAHWLIFGYSKEGKILAVVYMVTGYGIHALKEKRDFDEWKKKHCRN